MPIYSNWSMNSRISATHAEANLLLTAIDEYYRRNCAVVPFPQPTPANMQAQQLFIHQITPNQFGGGQWTFQITGVRTTTPMATVSMLFNDAATAQKIASRNRASLLIGSQVMWRKTLLRNRESGAISTTSQHIFSSNGC